MNRPRLVARVRRALRENPAVVLLGPRQCGKTTLARMVAAGKRATRFDLERPADLARLSNPERTLDGLEGMVILDEVQRMPALFEVLRVLIDRVPRRRTFLLLGSASPQLVRGVSETLAGRAAYLSMGGFDLQETGAKGLDRLWVRGGFPRSFLASSEQRSAAWRDDFVQSFVERDARQLGFDVPAAHLRRFWTMLAHYHGGIWNSAEIAGSLGISAPTVRRHLDILIGSFMVRELQPWHENLRKRQVKSPKVYVRDSGLLHALLSIPDRRALDGHPKCGSSWEGFAVEQVLSLVRSREAYFWSSHQGAELDLLIPVGSRRFGFEFKFSEAPTVTRSMRVAIEDLRLDRLYVVHPGQHSYPMDRRIEAIPLTAVTATDRGLRLPISRR